MTRYGLFLPPDADASELRLAAGKFDLLASPAECACGVFPEGEGEAGEEAAACALHYDLIDRQLSGLIPGENLKMRLEYLDCLRERIRRSSARGASEVMFFFDWGRAAGDAAYYGNMLEMLRSAEASLLACGMRGIFSVRVPERGVPAGFFRKLVFDLKGGSYSLAADFHLHDPAFVRSEWKKDFENASFEVRTLLYSYEPALGNRLSEHAVRETADLFARHELPLEVFFAPAKLPGTEFFREELEKLALLRGALC